MAAEVYECPSCGATVAAEATECPKCGEIFEASALQVEPTKKGRKTSGRRERLLFYAGVLLVLAGGPGIAVGSWLHDFLRIPIGGLAFETIARRSSGALIISRGVMWVIGVALRPPSPALTAFGRPLPRGETSAYSSPRGRELG